MLLLMQRKFQPFGQRRLSESMFRFYLRFHLVLGSPSPGGGVVLLPAHSLLHAVHNLLGAGEEQQDKQTLEYHLGQINDFFYNLLAHRR